MAQSTKKHWTTPELRKFKTSEELESFYGRKASAAERQKLAEMVGELQFSRGLRARGFAGTETR